MQTTDDTSHKGERIKRSDAERKHKRERAAADIEATRQRIPQRGFGPRETAVALGVSLPTVNRGIYSGKIPSTKILGRRIVSRETIDRLLFTFGRGCVMAKTVNCKACDRPFMSYNRRKTCSDACRDGPPMQCQACGESYYGHGLSKYCSDACRKGARAPAVYRFVSPDGRSYVGSIKDCRNRAKKLWRSNERLKAAFLKYPPETFRYEVLEHLPRLTPVLEIRRAEQRHIERLHAWTPEAGFNIGPAIRCETNTAEVRHAPA